MTVVSLIFRKVQRNDTLALLEKTKGSNWLRCRTEQDSFQAIATLLSFKPVRVRQATFTSNLHASHTMACFIRFLRSKKSD